MKIFFFLASLFISIPLFAQFDCGVKDGTYISDTQPVYVLVSKCKVTKVAYGELTSDSPSCIFNDEKNGKQYSISSDIDFINEKLIVKVDDVAVNLKNFNDNINYIAVDYATYPIDLKLVDAKVASVKYKGKECKKDENNGNKWTCTSANLELNVEVKDCYVSVKILNKEVSLKFAD